jgi:recombination protein RecA
MTDEANDKKIRLESTINAIQARYGHLALRRLKPLKQTAPHIPTGFPLLDEALGIGGLPRGHITELVSIPSSGATTIALHAVAKAQVQGLAVYLDVGQTFDPPTAVQLGVDLERLVMVEPNSWPEACAIMGDFIWQGESGIFVFDTPAHLLWETANAHTLAKALDRLIAPLGKTTCALLFIISQIPRFQRPISTMSEAPPPVSRQTVHAALAQYAAVRLLVYRARWLYGRHDIRGYEAKVYIAKNKLAAGIAAVNLTITLAGREGQA